MTVIQTFYGSFKPAVAVTGINVDKASVTLKTGEAVDFNVTVTPDNASNKRVTVTSSDTDLVTVAHKTGDTYTITALTDTDGGTANITVASRSDPSKTATVAVTVRVPVTSITVDKPTVSGDTKTSVDVTFTVKPDNATDKTITVTSSNAKTAGVALKSGTTYTISYLKGGEATVTAASKSDPTVSADVAVTAIQTGPSDEEKAAWTAACLKEVAAGTYKAKTPSATFEPLEGWTPFADYGTDPAEIISNAMKQNDTSALFVGDYFDVTVSGNKLRYEIAGFDQYLTNGSGPNPNHHALMVPTTAWPTTMAFNATSDNTYKTSDLHAWEENTFYANLPAKTKAAVMQVTIPWWNSSGQLQALAEKLMAEAGLTQTTDADGVSRLAWADDAAVTSDETGETVTPESKYEQIMRQVAQTQATDVVPYAVSGVHVFSLSEIEVFGSRTHSTESVVNAGGSAAPNHHIARFKDTASRIRKANNTTVDWRLRSAYYGSVGYACCVAVDGTPDYSGVSWTGGSAVPCFTLG